MLLWVQFANWNSDISYFSCQILVVWLVLVVFYEEVFKVNLHVPYSTICIGIYNSIITFFTSCSIILGYIKKSEVMLRVAKGFEFILIMSILVTSIVLFFYKYWIATVAGIISIFLYFYFYTVINNYIEELYQARKIMEVSASSALMIKRY
ncbi:hypothetical protein Anas_11583 [Armadillidium nasatum]|uniref:Uncharacterized protein n=1 Tax=Armadillidium nasatum TaxID=96803 RepID=A0A5N5TJ17_9CRUS|nr:hypothetical protein Anas_11583 [Armadillidium nasatum]